LRPPFVFAPDAEADVFQVWLYLLREAGRATADRVESEILDAFRDLAETPGRGHRRSDLTGHDVFFYAVYQYMVVYRIGTPLEVLAVIHGKRDVKRTLKRRL
jgi:antitoxin ParD1/3/4/toxin ParE1/3/4